MKIKSRSFLIALLIVSQAACLGLGIAWTTGWLWTNFEGIVYNYVVAEGKALAQEFVLKASSMELGDIEPGSDSWQQLQDLCEQEVIPHDGFVCAIGHKDGAMLCHPSLKDEPALAKLSPGRSLLINGNGSAPLTEHIRDAQSNNLRVVTGRAEFDGDTYVVTGFSLPGSDTILAVYQSDSAIDLFIGLTIRPIMQVGYILASFIVGATAIVSVFLTNLYDAELSEANARLELQVQRRTCSLLRTRDTVAFGLAKLADSRDRDTGEHLERMRSYVTILAKELALTHPEIDCHFVVDLANASSLHDIGKVGIPDAILMKPGPLTPDERRKMETHAKLGSDCLAAIREKLGEDDFLEMAQEIASSHHENWDGSGYPQGIHGNHIPLAARIVAIADVYDALTSPRPYKGPLGHVEARDWIVARYAQQFDPAVVEAFVAREVEFHQVSSAAEFVRSTSDRDKVAGDSDSESMGKDLLVTQL